MAIARFAPVRMANTLQGRGFKDGTRTLLGDLGFNKLGERNGHKIRAFQHVLGKKTNGQKSAVWSLEVEDGWWCYK